jgi:hypothetical protein
MVALNAWLQYRDAGKLMAFVNYRRNMRLAQTPQHQAGYLFWLGGKLGMLRMSVSFIVDQLRKLLLHGPELRRFESEQQQLKNERIMSRMNKDQLPWTMDTAFYALCGGSVMLAHDSTVKTVTFRGLQSILNTDHTKVLPIQRAALQDPSKASGLAKLLTCVQAFWFCSQCIARLSQNMAVSLLELNTFAHCVSAFFIYVFWWHKPYDAATHAYIDTSGLPEIFRTELSSHGHEDEFTHISTRTNNMADSMFSSTDWALAGFWRPLIMVLTFFVYGAMHLLAWQYHFPTSAERIIWRCASIATASSGSIVLLTVVRGRDWVLADNHARRSLQSVIYSFGLVAIAARSFLVIESFRALPNSPVSIYEVPRWSAYVPHI